MLDGIGAERKTTDPTAKHTLTRPDYVASANDNAIIEGIADSPRSLGWVGFAFAEENADTVKELGVTKEPNGTCVTPIGRDDRGRQLSDLADPLHLRQQGQGRRPTRPSAGYVDYYLADGTISTALETVPYVNLPADKLAATRTAWEAAE